MKSDTMLCTVSYQQRDKICLFVYQQNLLELAATLLHTRRYTTLQSHTSYRYFLLLNVLFMSPTLSVNTVLFLSAYFQGNLPPMLQ